MSLRSKIIGILKGVFGLTRVGSTVTADYQMLAPNGTASAPARSFTNDPNTGEFWRTDGHITISQNGTATFEYHANGLYLLSTKGIYWTTNVTGVAPDIGFERIVAGVLKAVDAVGGSLAWIVEAGRAIKAADQTVTDSATLVNDSHLSFTLKAGRKYSFKGHYHVTTVASSGVKLDFDGGTTTATSFDVVVKFFTASAVAVSTATAIATDHGSTAAVLLVEFEGTIVVNAAGTFIPRFAQNAETGAAESVVARLGSWMTMKDMP